MIDAESSIGVTTEAIGTMEIRKGTETGVEVAIGHGGGIEIGDGKPMVGKEGRIGIKIEIKERDVQEEINEEINPGVQKKIVGDGCNPFNRRPHEIQCTALKMAGFTCMFRSRRHPPVLHLGYLDKAFLEVSPEFMVSQGDLHTVEEWHQYRPLDQ